MAVCGFAEWRGPLPSTNYHAGPTAKQGLVMHVIVGSLSSADSEFHGAGAMLSAHFGIGNDGHLVQWLDTDDVSYAQVDGNGDYISCETEGQPTDPFTSAQITTAGQLVAWCATTHNFPLQTCDHGGQGLTTHAHYPSGIPDPSWGNHACPGPHRTAQLPNILAAATPTEDNWWLFS